ncbi:2OG-Fe(II) oxygenase [Paenibacillus sp. V4I9]|uniref:2OG-Fe(II) oxygenase n=1 Tax=Paenibacillus sp. V4I9 TaxID=3042308 RepID=UPI003593E890
MFSCLVLSQGDIRNVALSLANAKKRAIRRYTFTIDVGTFRFGSGEYRYDQYPLMNMLQELREGFYPMLVEVANRCLETLRP